MDPRITGTPSLRGGTFDAIAGALVRAGLAGTPCRPLPGSLLRAAAVPRRLRWPLAIALGFVCCGAAVTSAGDAWQSGTARANITPSEWIWMSGYASRDRPADGKLHDLWAKILVLTDAQDRTAVLITLDLVGIDRATSQAIVGQIAERYQLPREAVSLCSSHTHTGPVIGTNLRTMYFLNEHQAGQIRAYTERTIDQIVAAVGQALDARQPARLSRGQGLARFAVNRRNNPEPEVDARRASGSLVGPVDHDVPVLAVWSDMGQLRAVVCGYACHATTLSGYEWSGDYPGYAQIELERNHPGAMALFWAGCGADQNPIPRRTVEQAQDYGRQLAEAVDRTLASPLVPVSPRLEMRYAEIQLPFAKLPTPAELEADAASTDRYVASRARKFQGALAAGQPLNASYPYPIQHWRLGDDLTWIHLGGEVVVDYALRFKAEFGRANTWIAGYANDVMAYIPSLRVLREGGYEGGGAMVYYGLPSAWDETVEDRIANEVSRGVAAIEPVAASQ